LGLASDLYNQFQEGIVPHISLPSRTKAISSTALRTMSGSMEIRRQDAA